MSTPFDHNDIIDSIAMGEVEGWIRADDRKSAQTIHPKAWAFFKSDWLRPEKPTLAASHRRMAAKAKAEGWQPIPTLRTVRRWSEAERAAEERPGKPISFGSSIIGRLS